MTTTLPLTVLFLTRHRSASSASFAGEPVPLADAPSRWRFLVGRGHRIQGFEVYLDGDQNRPVGVVTLAKAPQGWDVQIVSYRGVEVARCTSLQGSIGAIVECATAQVELSDRCYAEADGDGFEVYRRERGDAYLLAWVYDLAEARVVAKADQAIETVAAYSALQGDPLEAALIAHRERPIREFAVHAIPAFPEGPLLVKARTQEEALAVFHETFPGMMPGPVEPRRNV